MFFYYRYLTLWLWVVFRPETVCSRYLTVNFEKAINSLRLLQSQSESTQTHRHTRSNTHNSVFFFADVPHLACPARGWVWISARSLLRSASIAYNTKVTFIRIRNSLRSFQASANDVEKLFTFCVFRFEPPQIKKTQSQTALQAVQIVQPRQHFVRTYPHRIQTSPNDGPRSKTFVNGSMLFNAPSFGLEES